MNDGLEPLLTVAQLTLFLDEAFPQLGEGRPQLGEGGRMFHLEHVGGGMARVRFEPDERHLRPGGTVSGPALFALADVAAYAVILAHIGRVGLAVTTHASIDFLRKPVLGPLFAYCTILKLGKRLAVTAIEIRQPAGGDLVAHATATYSIPPDS